ncbi:major facilitator superfamily domain-containing protein [Mycena galopus ATCC 62051]|nr:major facilitator superfamily domain-containing protein [Mycena galopus ATCC 62051]
MLPHEKPGLIAGYGNAERTKEPVPMTRDLGFLPIPRRLRYDPQKPFHFGLVLNVSIHIVTLLSDVQFSDSFGVDYNHVSRYAMGILLISPLGDLVRRRQLILLLSVVSGSLTIGLAVTRNLVVFETLSFLIGVVSVIPQIMIHLAADLAPPERRASAISVVLSGLLFGILIAPVLAGILGQFTSWRIVYYFAIGVQFLVFIAGYFVIPDYPAKNSDLRYWGILRTMVKFAYREPILIQARLVNLASACFTNFWVTSLSCSVGLPSLVAVFAALCFQAIQVGAGDISVGAIVVVIMGLDVFRQMLQMSLATAVFSTNVAARARLNAVLMLSVFIGQLIGTSVGTEVFTKYGWRAAAALNLGFYAWMLFIMMLHGPHCVRYTWFGFEGGWEARKSIADARRKAAVVKSVSAEKDLESGGTTTPQTKFKSRIPRGRSWSASHINLR